MHDRKTHGQRYEERQRERALAVLKDTRDVKQAAEQSGAATRTVRRWAREAGLPPVRAGGSVRNLDRRAFMRLLGGGAAMLAASPSSTAKLLGREPTEPTGTVRAYFVPGGVFASLALGVAEWGRRVSSPGGSLTRREVAEMRESLAEPTAEPHRLMQAVRESFSRGEIHPLEVDWGRFQPPAAGFLVVNDTVDEVEIGATLWSTGHVQCHVDGAPVELDLLTPEKACALGLRIR